MSVNARQFSPMFSIDVTADAATQEAVNKIDANELICVLLRQLVEGQQREIGRASCRERVWIPV